jgi:4-diphosphocytidyl-2-C-methyl-D-erythritol kinase
VSGSGEAPSDVLYRAPAKVNLVLEVLGRRADGFHELDTLMMALDLGDDVLARASETAGARIEVGGPAASEDVPADERNLAVRAALGVLELAGEERRGVDLVLTKRVPSRAGLGGGSSDAAAAALATRDALGLAVPDVALCALLAELGSDCVFFQRAATTGLARCQGRGDRVAPLAPPPDGWRVALVAPAVECGTAEVYSALNSPLSGSPEPPSLPLDLLERGEEGARVALSNTLEAAALKTVPDLRRWRALLDRCAASHFRLTGSGSTFFGLYRGDGEGEADLARIGDEARTEGLGLRGTWWLRPSGLGAHRVAEGA